MADFEAAMEELAYLCASPEFKEKQQAFFDRYCDEFEGDVDGENKLAYTAIHKEYEEQIEGDIEAVLGPEKLQMLCAGAAEYAQTGKALETEAGAEALDLLTSLGDFQAFKAAMLARKAAKNADGVALGEVKGVLRIDDVMDRTKELKEAADAGGWNVVADEPNAILCIKPKEGSKDSYLRYTFQLDLPVEQAAECFMSWAPESINWRERIKSIETVRDYGPEDKVVSMALDIPWAIKYIMSMDDVMTARVVSRANWPEPGDFAYAVMPFDLEQNVCLEEKGVLKVKTGVISPDPSGNQQKSQITGCDLVSLGMVPSWGLGYLLKKMSLPTMATQTERYKKWLATQERG